MQSRRSGPHPYFSYLGSNNTVRFSQSHCTLQQLTPPPALQIPQIINSAVADLYSIMRENVLHYRGCKPAEMRSSSPSQAGTDGSPASEEPCSPAATAPHTDDPDATQHPGGAAQSNWQSSDRPIAQPCFELPDSPDCRSPRQSEPASPEESECFSPVYRATSPSYSPRGSPGPEWTPDQAAHLYDSASFAAAEQGIVQPQQEETVVAQQEETHVAACNSGSTELKQGSKVKETTGPSHADTAVDSRPSTARGCRAPRCGSRFCFARPAAAQAQPQDQDATTAASPAATTQGATGSNKISNSSTPQVPAEEPNQGPAADLSSGTEHMHMGDRTHKPAGDAAAPAAAAAEAGEAPLQEEPTSLGIHPNPLPTFKWGHETEEPDQGPGADISSFESMGDSVHKPIGDAATPTAAAEALHEPTFVWGQAEFPASQHSSSCFFKTTAGASPCGSAQAASSSHRQPHSHSRIRAESRRKASSKSRSGAKQAGNVPSAGSEPSAWASAASSAHGFKFGNAPSQFASGAEDKNSMPSSLPSFVEDRAQSATASAAGTSSFKFAAAGASK